MGKNARESIKIVLLNNKKELLLLLTDDSSIKTGEGRYNGRFYQLVGGKMEEGESVLEAARRELFEETGLTSKDVHFGNVIWKGKLDLNIHGELTHINQRFILARTNKLSVTLKNLTNEEKKTCQELRWMNLDEIKNSDTNICPRRLPVYLKDVLEGNIPVDPIFVDLN